MSLLMELSAAFGMGRADLVKIISTAPARYKTYEIEKRRGGTRTIAHPSVELKALQRFILAEKFSSLPVHGAAMGYVKKRGIGTNANAHIDAKFLLKLDFKNFFPSITPRDWVRCVRKVQPPEIETVDISLYVQILFWGKVKKCRVPTCLSIGAPTSPAISNIVMYDMDVALSQEALDLGLVYTRYADDITVSGNQREAVQQFEQRARRIVRQSKSPSLEFNEDKCRTFGKGQKKLVTGLIITPVQKVSIGRGRKREISALLHRSSLDQLTPELRGYLKGMLGFAIAHEPMFVTRMRAKYGNNNVDQALQYHVPRRRNRELDAAPHLN